MLKSVLAEQHDFKRESSAKWRFWDWCLCLTSFLPCVSIFNFSCENLSQILWYKHHSRIKLEFHVLLAWHGSLWWESAGSLIAVLSRGCRQNSISLLSIFWWVLLFFFLCSHFTFSVPVTMVWILLTRMSLWSGFILHYITLCKEWLFTFMELCELSVLTWKI